MFLEFAEAGFDDAGRATFFVDRLLRLESVAGDAEHGAFVGGDFAGGDELFRAGDGDTAGGLGENAFALSEQAGWMPSTTSSSVTSSASPPVCFIAWIA